jgi:hypothetical protein
MVRCVPRARAGCRLRLRQRAFASHPFARRVWRAIAAALPPRRTLPRWLPRTPQRAHAAAPAQRAAPDAAPGRVHLPHLCAIDAPRLTPPADPLSAAVQPSGQGAAEQVLQHVQPEGPQQGAWRARASRRERDTRCRVHAAAPAPPPASERAARASRVRHALRRPAAGCLRLLRCAASSHGDPKSHNAPRCRAATPATPQIIKEATTQVLIRGNKLCNFVARAKRVRGCRLRSESPQVAHACAVRPHRSGASTSWSTSATPRSTSASAWTPPTTSSSRWRCALTTLPN